MWFFHFPRKRPDHSQYGEFSLFLKHAGHRKRGLVVDAGAHGRERSNSWDLLSQFGWRGLLIEANPNLWEAIEREFIGLDYTLVRTALADTEGERTLYLGVNDDISSFHRVHTEQWGPVHGSIDVTARRLGNVLVDHRVPEEFDLLSLDIEGMDIAVLNDLISTSRYRPRWIFIEASFNFAVKSLDAIDLAPAVKEAYRLVSQTEANLLLKRRIR